MKLPQIEIEVLERAVADLFRAAGVAQADALCVAEDLVAADVEGIASHGIMLVPMYLDRIKAGSVRPAADRTVVSDRAAAVVLDAANTLGQPTARQAAGLAVEKAREVGLGAVAVRNAFHIGALNRYARMMADQGCVALVTTNTRPLLPATGGATPITGNNPLAVAVPSSGGYAAEVDMALSAVAMGKIRNAMAAGQPIPEGWATDAAGRPTTDAAAAIQGMLLPAAGPKGFGLAFVLDLIAGGLSGGAAGPEVGALYGDPAKPYACAAFFLAVDTGHFTDAAAMAQRVDRALSRTSASALAPGVARVFAPGELAHASREAAAGLCRPQPQALDALIAAGAGLDLDLSYLKPKE